MPLFEWKVRYYGNNFKIGKSSSNHNINPLPALAIAMLLLYNHWYFVICTSNRFASIHKLIIPVNSIIEPESIQLLINHRLWVLCCIGPFSFNWIFCNWNGVFHAENELNVNIQHIIQITLYPIFDCILYIYTQRQSIILLLSLHAKFLLSQKYQQIQKIVVSFESTTTISTDYLLCWYKVLLISDG